MADEKDYESRIIGGFIYLLGVEQGRRQSAVDARAGWVDLFQQTPLDTQWGDLIAQSDSRYVLVEFKRLETLVRREFEKDHRKRLLADLKRPEARSNWGRMHYVAYGSMTSDFSVTFQPYARITKSPLQPPEERTPLAEFLQGLVETGSIGVTIGPFEEYLRLVAQCGSEKKEGGDDGVAVAVRQGQLATAAYTSIAGFADRFEAARRNVRNLSGGMPEQSPAPGQTPAQPSNSGVRRQDGR